MSPKRRNAIRLVVGCDLGTFKRYSKTNGHGEDLGITEEHIVNQDHFTLLSGERAIRSLVTQSGMKLTLKNAGRENPETKGLREEFL